MKEESLVYLAGYEAGKSSGIYVLAPRSLTPDGQAEYLRGVKDGAEEYTGEEA